MGQQDLRLVVILALVGSGICLKIESANPKVEVYPDVDGEKYKVYMNENNHDWNGDPTPLFKIADFSTSQVPPPQFGQDTFKYNVEGDVMYATQSFDYETQVNTYIVNIQDTKSTIIIIFNIRNIDDEMPTLSFPQCTFDEHTLYDAFNSTCNCTVSDQDGWLGKMTFKIIPTTKNEDQIFHLTFKEPPEDDQYEANVYITISNKLDYKTANFYSFDIQAEDSNHNPTKPKYVRASVTVKDLRDTKPIWTKYFTVNQIDELTKQTFTFEAIDGDTGINEKVFYSKISEQNPTANYITIDQNTGVLNIKPIDRDTDDLSVYRFQINAYINEPGDWSTPQDVSLYINDLDNNPPVITTKDDTPFELYENYDGSLNRLIRIVDKDTGENAQFSVTLEKSPDTEIDYTEAFIITPNSGYKNTTSFDISVRNKTYLDFENPDWRTITFNILATGKLNETKQDKLKVTVNLKDLNDEPPIFDKSEYAESIKETAKKGASVIQVMATDQDQEDKVKGLNHVLLGSQSITDSLKINSKTGEVTVNVDNAFDYDKVNPVIFQVRAEDNAKPPHTATVPVIINILDVNNKKPTINTGDPIQVKENQLIGTKLDCKISATDPDTTADLKAEIDWSTSYAMKNSIRLTDQNKNAIRFLDIAQSRIGNTSDIKIDLKVNNRNENETSPDFETFDSLYLNIVVEDKATDAEFKPTQSTANALVMISIIDVNDNAPYFPEATASKPENRTVTEKTAIDTPLGYSIQAIDVDLNDSITYTCSPDNENYDWLKVHPQTGAFSVKSDGINADIPLDYFNYTCTANDSVNHQSEPLKVPFYIIDTNDQKPSFTLDPEIHIDEELPADTEVKAIKPTDKDRDLKYKQVQCSVTGDDNCQKQFKVDYENIIRVKIGDKAIDRDKMDDPTFTCKVKCEDCPDCRPEGRLFMEQSFKIILDDINDNTPVLDMPDAPMNTYENVKKDEKVLDDGIIAQDIDEGDNAAIIFSIQSVIGKEGMDYSDLFYILPDDTYQNKTRKKADLLPNKDLRGYFGEYTLSIQLCDKGTPPRCGVYNLTLEVKKFNFIAPKFVFPDKDDQKFVLQSVQQPGSPLIIYGKGKKQLQDLSVTDNEDTNTCIRWDTDISLKQVQPKGNTFFMREKIDTCRYQLQIKGDFDPDINTQYELELSAKIDKDGEPLPGEGNYTSRRNILITFFSNTQEPTFVDCETQVFKTKFYEEDINQKYTLECQAKYQIDDPDLQKFYFLVSDNKTIHSLFKVDNATGTVELLQKLDFETDEEFEFQIVASKDLNPTSTNPMSYVKIIVEVIDINDHAPEFNHKQYFGAIMTGYMKSFTIIELKATDVDRIDEGKLTYSIEGDFERKGEGIQDIKVPFTIQEVTGKIALNFAVEATMSGFFSFTVMVKDVQDEKKNGPYNSTAPVTVFILTSDNTVKFRFENTVDEVKEHEDEMCSAISDVLKLDAHKQNIDRDKDNNGKELNTTVASLYFINNTEETQMYSLTAKPVEVVESTYILRQVRNVETYLRLSRDLLTQAKLKLLSFPSSETQSDDSDLLRVWLIGVSIVLGALCVMLIIVFIIKTRRLSNKIKKLTSKQFGSQESGLNNLGITAPNTNRNAVEGSNPVFRDDEDFRKDSIMDFVNTAFDKTSTKSGDSELQDVELNPEFDLAFDKNENEASNT